MGKNKKKKRMTNGVTKEGHIFDDVFRTMEEHMPELMIPLINEVFGTKYPLDAEITRFGDRHHRFGFSIETDSVLGIQKKRYHLECESSKATGEIIVRMVEYDLSVALDTMEQEDGIYIMQFPNSCVLYLRHNSQTKDKERLIVRMADGQEIDYIIPIIKTQEYSLDEIFEKKLYLLLPFYLLRYEKQLLRIEQNEQEREAFLREYQMICDRLAQKVVDRLVYTELQELMKRVNNYILRNQSQLKKGVQNIMGGRVIENTPIGMYRKGLSEGHAEGHAEGTLQTLLSLVKDRLLEIKVAAERAGITEEEFKKLLEEKDK